MDFFINNIYILEVAGLVTSQEYYFNKTIKDKIRNEYREILKDKELLLNNTEYKLIIIFKNDSLREIKEKIAIIDKKIWNLNLMDIKKGNIVKEKNSTKAFENKIV